jgi:hypothetical protein
MEEIDMNIRKVLAGSMAALAAGATVAFGAFAQSSSLGDFVDNSGSSPVAPWVVVGAGNGNPEYAKDVVGAADIAAAVAGFATTDRAIGGGAEVSVSGGVSLSTSNTKIYTGDNISAAKDTLTSEDLPVILASNVFQDDDGDEFEYDQYLVVGDRPVTLSTSSDDEVLGNDPDPVLLVDIGTDYAAPVYTLRVVFNDDLNLTDSDIEGNEIELFGTTYSISSDTAANKLVLFGSANKQTLQTGETATVTVGGESYEVRLVGITSSETVVLNVDGVQKEVAEDASKTIAGLEVYADDVFYFDPELGVASTATLSFGSAQMTFENGKSVKVGSGSDEESIDGTQVSMTAGTGSGTISVMEIAVAGDDSDGDFAAVDYPFTDPVFGTVKLAFGGGTPNMDSMATFDFGTSGGNTATAAITDSKGNSETVEWAYDSAKSTAGTTLALADGDNDDILVLEGAQADEDDYVVINQDDFAHMLEVTDIELSNADDEGTIDLKDVFTGSTYTVDLDEGSTNYYNGTKIIDGKTYKFWADNSGAAPVMRVVWGTGSANLATSSGYNVGSVTSVFPTIVAEDGAEIAFLNNISVGTGHDGDTFDILGIEVTLADGTNTITGTGIDYTYGNATTGYLTIETVSGPALLLLEEEGEDASGSDVQNAIIVETEDDSDGIEIKVSSSPLLTDTTATSYIQLGSDDDKYIATDRYGAMVEVDSSDQGEATIYYPDDQVIMAVGIGSNPVFSMSGESGTVQEAYQLTSPIAKLANEVTSPSTLNRDIILIGGPCANSLVATLMDAETAYPACTEAADLQGLDEGLIKVYDDAFGSGQKALVVAGMMADDTRALAARVMSGTLDYSN